MLEASPRPGRSAQPGAELSAEGVSREFGPVVALRPTSLHIGRGEHVAIVGRSGAGKSTLLQLLAGMDRPSTGTVTFAGQDLTDLSDERLAKVRRERFGFVFQASRLVPYLSVTENVSLPLLLVGEGRAAAEGRAKELLDELGLEALAGRHPDELSGGERQRVAVARALAHAPSVVFADEPTGNLDSDTRDIVIDTLASVCRDRTLVLVTHDTEIAGTCPRQLHVSDGAVRPEAIASEAPRDPS